MLNKGVVAWQLPAYITGLSILIALSIYKKATLRWKRLDIICLVAVLLAILLYVFTGDSNNAIIVSLIANTIATFPMFRNLWKNPNTENLPAWLLLFAGGICGVLGITNWTVAEALPSVNFLFLQAIIVALILRRFRF